MTDRVFDLPDYLCNDNFVVTISRLFGPFSWVSGIVWSKYRLQIFTSNLLCLISLFCNLYLTYTLFLDRSFVHIESKLLGIVIYSFTIINVIGFRRLWNMWPKISALWIKTENDVDKFIRPDLHLKRRMRLIAMGAVLMLTAEHGLRLVTSTLMSEPKTITNIYSNFVLRSETVMVSTTEETHRPDCLLHLLVSTIISILVNFRDLAVSLFSLGLLSKQKQINKLIREICENNSSLSGPRLKNWRVRTWRRTRQMYVLHATLVRTTNTAIGLLVMSSCIENMVFTSRILYLGHNFYSYPVVNLIEKVSYTYQLLILLVRGFFVLLSAAAVNVEYNKTAYYFGNVNTRTYYDVEVRRLLFQIRKEIIAIRGAEFFKISRNTIIHIITIVITYELMIAQST